MRNHGTSLFSGVKRRFWPCCFNRCQTKPKKTCFLGLLRSRSQNTQVPTPGSPAPPADLERRGTVRGPHRMHELITVRNPAALALSVRNTVGFKIPSLSAALVQISMAHLISLRFDIASVQLQQGHLPGRIPRDMAIIYATPLRDVHGSRETCTPAMLASS